MLLAAPSAARAWDATGHRIITWLALDGLSADVPAFLRESDVREAIGWQAGEPDRWRAVRIPQLVHENAMDHYLDVEDLATFGLTLDTVNPLRYRFVRDMNISRYVHPTGPDGNAEPYNEARDPVGQGEYPGFVAHAMMEAWAKIVASFKTYRILERLNDPARSPQMMMERANIMVQMGILSHFVGDTAQPLHTTKHHHGWVGDNPRGYTTDRGIHSYIDGKVIELHALTYTSLKGTAPTTLRIDAADPWKDVLAHIQRSFDQVEPLYIIEKSGALKQAEGKAFITERLNDGAAMLAALYNAAWAASAITDKDVTDFIGFDGWKPDDVPGAGNVPVGKPAATPGAGQDKPAPGDPMPADPAAPKSNPAPGTPNGGGR